MLAALALSACSEASIESDYQDYLTRLARVLEQDSVDWQASIAASLPSRYPYAREREIATEDTRIGVLDFLSLQDCDLRNLISERNSSLGKVMSVTARYHYEKMLLNALDKCLASNNLHAADQGDLRAKLTAIRQLKVQELPVHHWNATWGSDIFRMFFALSHPPLGQHEVSGVQPVAVDALGDYFARLSPADSQAESPADETSFFAQSKHADSLLQPLQYHYGGRLIRSLVTATAAINESTRLIDAALAERPICFNNKPSLRAEYLNNVFRKYYVAGLQPYLSHLDREANALLGVTRRYAPHRYESTSQGVLAFYDVYLDPDTDNPLHDMRRAIKAHAMTWNSVLRDCGIRVGAAPPSD